MILLKKTDSIRKNKCLITLSEERDNYSGVCKVECTGRSRKYKWTHLFPSVYGGYAMLREKYLIDLPGKCFLAHQVNEHSKGGHCEYEIQLMDLLGNVLNTFSGGIDSNFILDNRTVWFLKSGKKHYSIGSIRDVDLIQLNIVTGKVEKTLNLNDAQLFEISYTELHWYDLIERKGDCFLQIKQADNLNKIFVKRIALENIKKEDK